MKRTLCTNIYVLRDQRIIKESLEPIHLKIARVSANSKEFVGQCLASFWFVVEILDMLSKENFVPSSWDDMLK